MCTARWMAGLKPTAKQTRAKRAGAWPRAVGGVKIHGDADAAGLKPTAKQTRAKRAGAWRG